VTQMPHTENFGLGQILAEWLLRSIQTIVRKVRRSQLSTGQGILERLHAPSQDQQPNQSGGGLSKINVLVG